MEINKDRKLWFKRKWYGWGWYPASREGWLVTVIYAGALIALTTAVSEGADQKEWWLFFVLPVVLLTVTFVRIAYKYGEKPRWQWGRQKNDQQT